jgi:hypothetical protein
MATTPGHVLILTGPPGAGKSTAARRLALEARGVMGGVHVHGDDFMDYIRSGFVEPWKPESRDQNVTITRALSAACFAFAGGGYLAVLDWIVGPWFLDIYREDAARTGIALDYILLRPSEDLASRRARERTERPVADYEHLRPLYAQMSEMGELERHVIETTHLSLEDTLRAIRTGMEDGRYRLG